MILAKGRQETFAEIHKTANIGNVAIIPQPRSIALKWKLSMGGRPKAQPRLTASTANPPSNSPAVTAKFVFPINSDQFTVLGFQFIFIHYYMLY